MEPVEKFRVVDPKNPTINEKTRMLVGLLQHNLKAQDFKFTAFVSAARSEDYNNLLHPMPPGFSTQDGQIDIVKLREVIVEVPPFSQLHQILKQKRLDKINPEVINLIFWVIVYAQNICEISANEFMSNLAIPQVDRCNGTPAHVFKVTARREEWFESFVVHHNTTTEIGYYFTKYGGIFKILVDEFKIKSPDYLLLKDVLNPALSMSERVWENSEFFTEFGCIAVCAIAPVNGGVEKITSKSDNSYTKVYDANFILLKYLALYEDKFTAGEVENSTRPWWKVKKQTALLGISTLLAVIIAVKAAKSRLYG